MEILTLVGQYLLPVLGSVLTVVLVALAKKYMVKLGIERSEKVDAMVDKYVAIGVNAAERAGTSYLAAHNLKLPGSRKKVTAINVVLDELKQSGVTDVGKDLIAARIESWLEDKAAKKLTG
jgi:hypothetical protein